MKFLYKYFFTLILILILASCHKTHHVPGQPRFVPNGGNKNVNRFNEKKANQERKYMTLDSTLAATKKLLEKQTKDFESIDSEYRIGGIENKINELDSKIDELMSKLKEIDPTTTTGYASALEIEKAMNELIYSRVLPIGEIIKSNKKINKISGDLSFATGKSNLTDAGKAEIKAQIDDIESDILEWKEYVNKYETYVFSKDDYKLIVLIEGYADKQGNENYNLKLSEQRAESVRNEYVEHLKNLESKYNLVYKIDYYGKGEKLPSGVEDNGKEVDVNRRICRLISVVGPKNLIEE